MVYSWRVLATEPLSSPARQPVSLQQGRAEVKGDALQSPGVCGYLNQAIIRHMKAIRYAPHCC